MSRRSSASGLETRLAGTPVHALWTSGADGDMRDVGDFGLPPSVPRDRALRRVRQVHGGDVVVVDTPVPDRTVPFVLGPGGLLPEADAVVGSGDEFALAVLTADCAPVALGSPEGVHAAVHVGWRGLGAAVLARAIDTMRSLGATTVVAGLGPCIGPCCYEFSEVDLDALSESSGSDVRARTTWGELSLDLPTAVRGQLARSEVPVVAASDVCTVCTPGYFSHRARGDEARQALLVWRGH
ncbi:MAG TPA: polyphenol oxidase family protein [Acidimicrobiales bacterium]|nr:polyphenol oxidase family protein [Acidimicrobiales bacterium]